MIDYYLLKEEVKALFTGDSGGHDYFHTLRVYNNAMMIAENEDCDRDVTAAAALLHDADDVKLFSSADYDNARRIMKKLGIDDEFAGKVIDVISTVSFAGKDSVVPETIEGRIVQDADRLDAIGAVGIARAFAYGGSRGRCIYDPDVKPVMNMDKETYHKNSGHTINHFYEKLLLLKDMMNTETAKRIAEHRHAVMENYLSEFYDEWNGRK